MTDDEKRERGREQQRRYRAHHRKNKKLREQRALLIPQMSPEERRAAEARRERLLRIQFDEERANWPAGCRSGGTCSPRGRFYQGARENWSDYGTVGSMIWHNFTPRAFEREMQIPWRRR